MSPASAQPTFNDRAELTVPNRWRQRAVRCDGRVVKALDLKSNGIFPRRFEPCSQRCVFL